MKWFKHDSGANMDGKLQEVLLDYGLEGYGLYFYCLELISGKIEKENVEFKLEHDARIIARNTGSTTQKVQDIMNKFVDLKLFEVNDGHITCFKMAKRLDQSMTSNPAMRQIINQIKENNNLSDNNHDPVMTQSNKPMIKSDKIMIESSKPMQDKTRLDQIRLDKKKEKKPAFAKPTCDEVNKFAFDNKLNLEGFFDYYESNGWKVGKNPMKKWDAAARGWSKRQGGFSNQQKQPDFNDDSTEWAEDLISGKTKFMGFE